MPIPPTCWTCSESLGSATALQAHGFAAGHPCFVCEPCDRAFACFSAWDQHFGSARHTRKDIGPAHLPRLRRNDHEARDDQADQGPFCSPCNRKFCDMDALNQHLLSSALHNWCSVCSRDFSTEASLAQHETSIAHQSRDFKCPSCPAMFKSPSGIAHHIESGCLKITRHQVAVAVQGSDIVPNNSIKCRTSLPTLSTPSRLIAADASFDGMAYKCHLCRKSCRTQAWLNVHLNSAAHDDDEFRCPGCKREFTVISGFVQHLESRSCGPTETTLIEGFFDDLSDRFSRLLKV